MSAIGTAAVVSAGLTYRAIGISSKPASAMSSGMRIPEDIALAGFDDIPIARYVSPPLTTAAVPIAEIGRQALECCAAIIAGRPASGQRTFKPELVVRPSTQHA